MKLKSNLKNPLKTTTDYEIQEKIILRDFLAMERTKLANERTYLTYIRFSLYLLIGGISILQLPYLQELYFIGWISIVLSVLGILIGTIRFFQLKKQLKSFYKKVDKDQESI